MARPDGEHAPVTTSGEVAAALADGRPVVALETTLVAHGLPRPTNLETAGRLEAIVREGGAVPATVGVVAGELIVGLDDDQLALLATADDVRKCSRRDLPIAMARGEHGATTVAGTLAAIGPAGIPVLATGGIGGVHRGAEATFDVSADLGELARARAVVVCAGPKALLDVPRTVEVLETLGVPTLGWRTELMPTFYASGAGPGPAVTARVESAAGAAAIAATAWRHDLARGLLLAVPPPDGALEKDVVEQALSDGLQVAAERGLSGPALTPFLLDAVARTTGGRSLDANVALLENNARVATELAVVLAVTLREHQAQGAIR